VAHPFLEDIHQELAVLLRTDCAVGDEIAGLLIEQPLLPGLLAPPLVGDSDGLWRRALDDGDELNEPGAQFVTEEAVDRAPVFLLAALMVQRILNSTSYRCS
jgi:hypothetical protein